MTTVPAQALTGETKDQNPGRERGAGDRSARRRVGIVLLGCGVTPARRVEAWPFPFALTLFDHPPILPIRVPLDSLALSLCFDIV